MTTLRQSVLKKERVEGAIEGKYQMKVTRSLGMILLLGLAAFNLLNILYFYTDIPSVYLLVVIAVLFVFVRFNYFVANKSGLSQGELLAGLLILLMICVVIAQNLYLKSYTDSDGVDSVRNITTMTMVCLLWMIAGAGCTSFAFRRSFIVSVLVSLGVVSAVYFAVGEDLVIDHRDGRAETGLDYISHLLLEVYVVILLAFAFSMSRAGAYLTICLAIPTLFFLGGRTALILFPLTGFLVLGLTGSHTRNFFAFVFFVCSFSAIYVYLVSNGTIDLSSGAMQRILFLEGIEEDGSFEGRVDLLSTSWEFLEQQMWIGNHGLSAERHSSFSAYAHNLLSAWQFYGIFVFLSLIVCLFYSLWKMSTVSRNSEQPADVFGSFLIIYVVISVIVSKFVGWYLMWFAIGYWLFRPISKTAGRKKSGRSKKRRRRRRSTDRGLDFEQANS